MPRDDSELDMESGFVGRVRPFFSAAHLARILLMALLAASAVGTIGQAVWQLAQTTEQISGTFVEVAETRASNISVIYSLVMKDEHGEFLFVRLRNNGRILNHLGALGDGTNQQLIVRQSQGAAQSLTILDAENQTITESRASAQVQLLIGGLLLVVLVLHVRPR